MGEHMTQSMPPSSQGRLHRSQFRQFTDFVEHEDQGILIRPRLSLKYRLLVPDGQEQQSFPEPESGQEQGKSTSQLLTVDSALKGQKKLSWLNGYAHKIPPSTFGVEHGANMRWGAVSIGPDCDLEKIVTTPMAVVPSQSGTAVEDVLTVRLAAVTAQGNSQAKAGVQEKQQRPEDIYVAVDQPEFDQHSTLQMMALAEVSTTTQQREQVRSSMQSEVSGAASAAGLVGFGNIIGTLFKYVGVFLIQYGFGAGLYGLYTLSTSLINLIASVFNLGLDDAMVRYTAIYRSKKQLRSLVGLTVFCTALAGVAGIAGALLLLLFAPSLVALNAARHAAGGNENSIEQVIPLLQMMAPLIPLYCMQVVWVGGLRGFKAFKWRVLVANIVQPTLLIILLGAVLLFFRNITGVAIALLISVLCSVAFNLYFLFRELSKVATPEVEHYEVREWLGFASLNFLTTIVDTVLDSTDTILLAVFGVPKTQIGQYGAAIRYSAFISLPLLSLNSIFAPTIAELHSKGKQQELDAMFKIVTKWTITFSMPIFLMIVLFSPYILGLSGSSFVAAWPLAVAFALGGLVNAGTGAVGYMLLMTGYQKLSFLNSLAAVVTNVVLGIILTPRYGAMGTAVSTGLAICVLNIMRLLQVRFLLKMQPYRWDVLKPIGAGLIGAAVVGAAMLLLQIGQIRTSFILGHAIISLQLALVPVFLAIYIMLVILFKGSPEDEIVMKSLRKKFLRSKNRRRN